MSKVGIHGRHMTALVTAVCIAIVLAPLAAQAGGSASRTTKVKGTVNVGNFPATQNVAGTVNVGNMPAVQHVDGTVSVGNLPSTQSVTGAVTANPGLPGTPFSASGTGTAFCKITVPADKHFVIQTVSVQAGITTGSQPEVLLEYITGGATSVMYIPVTDSFTFSGNDFYEATVPVDIYADPSSTVTVLIDVFGSGSQQGCNLTASGYEI